MSSNKDSSDKDIIKYKSFSDICEEMLERVPTNSDKKSKIEENIMNLFRGVVEYGFESPTPIQAKTIIPLHSGRDIIAQSQSGTGKTGAFTIGFLSRINPSKNVPQAIILATTRELATQINSVCKNISTFLGIKTCLSIGGDYMGVNKNIQDAKTSHVIIGTPGRMGNIIKDKGFKMKYVKTFILDEADALLSDDFVEQIQEIIMELDKSAQICVFSATLDEKTLKVTENFMSDPLTITLKKEELSLDIIKQFRVELEFENYKIPTLFDLYKKLTITQAVIFANTVNRAKYVHSKMEENGHEVGLIHGQMTCDERVDILRRFRKGEIRVIIATDVIARGIDVQQIGLVFNYDIPQDKVTYLHRIGRSGRYGKIGVAINFIVAKPDSGRKKKPKKMDIEKMEDITNHYNNQIEHLPNPEKINKILMGK